MSAVKSDVFILLNVRRWSLGIGAFSLARLHALHPTGRSFKRPLSFWLKKVKYCALCKRMSSHVGLQTAYPCLKPACFFRQFLVRLCHCRMLKIVLIFIMQKYLLSSTQPNNLLIFSCLWYIFNRFGRIIAQNSTKKAAKERLSKWAVSVKSYPLGILPG